MTTCVIFEEITQKLASRENYASEEIKCTIFFYYSSSDTINCHSIQATINYYANNIECPRDERRFYYSSQFYMATFPIMRLHDAKTLTHIYLISVSINRMLISQLKKIFSCKIDVSTSIQCLILHLFLISML